MSVSQLKDTGTQYCKRVPQKDEFH